MLCVVVVSAQDFGRKNGLGIRISGSLTFNQEAGKLEQIGKTLFDYNPNQLYRSVEIGTYYKGFILYSRTFAEIQLSGYYLKDKSELYPFDVMNPSYENAVNNINFKEWGASSSLYFGYCFPINKALSIDAFSGPEIRYTISCQTRNNQSLLDWHYNHWQMRWKLGTGVNYSHVGVQVYGSYDVTKKSKQVNTRDFTLSLGLGYKF